MDGPNGTVYAVRSCELRADGSAYWMAADVSLCREQDLSGAESIAKELEKSCAKQMTPILLNQVADQVTNLVDFAVVDPVVRIPLLFDGLDRFV